MNRPFADFKEELDAEILNFYTDAVKGEFLGLRGVFRENWIFAQWELQYIKMFNPSIEYLELLAITVAFFAWADQLRNCRIVLFAGSLESAN